jgi:zinc transporter
MTETASVVFALGLDGNGRGTPLSEDVLGETRPAWLHFDYSAPDARSRLQELGLPFHAVNTLVRLESRPHTLTVGDGLMIILRGINRNAGADPEDMVSLRLWLERDRLVSVRQRPVKAAQSLRADLEAGNGPSTVPGLVVEIVTRLADGIALFVDDVEERLERLEDLVDDRVPGDLRGEISGLRRQIASVRRYLAPERDSLESLIRLAGGFFDETQVYALREQSDRITRYVEDLDLVRERALVTQEELMNRIAQEQNTRTYLFTIVAAVFLPITFISGVFGMNTAGLPGLEDPRAFWFVAGAMAAIAVAVTVWLRLKRWF